MPSCSTRCATRSSNSGVRGWSCIVSLCTKNGIGTPQLRWRDTHQSGRVLIIASRRGRRPAPVALARHAPGGAFFDHRFEAGAPPGGKEFGLFDGLVGEVAQARSIMLRPRRAMLALLLHQRLYRPLSSVLRPLSSGIHPDEPLRRGAENDRRLVAPAMRITVLHFFQMQ